MKLAAITTLFLSFVPFVRAQDAKDAAPAGPAPELARLERLIGNYTGKGTAVMEPGKAPAEWTCQSTYAWTLGKHFVAVETAVDFGSAIPPLAFRELLGWDGEAKRYVAISIGNTGEGSLGEVTFPSAERMVMIVSKKDANGPAVERHETTFTKDGMQFRMTILGSTGAAIEGVTGSFTRVDKQEPLAIEATAAMAPPAPPLAKMHRLAGTYEFAGEVILMPGTPAMKIRGTDFCRPIFGGAALQISTTGNADGSPDAYAAETFVVWNEGKQCFDAFGADNMGQVGAMEQRFSDDGKIVATGAACFMGQPMVQRMLIELDAAGKMTKATSTTLSGASEPYRSFQGTYKLGK